MTVRVDQVPAFVSRGASPNTWGTSLLVDELDRGGEGTWDDFVRDRPDAQPQHLLGWRDVIARTYGFRPRYLVAKTGGQIVGVMPLFEAHSHLQGYHLTTLPGGICAASEGAGLALIERAKELCIDGGADFLAIRDSRQCWDAGMATRQSEYSISLDVSTGPAQVRAHLPRQVRQFLKRAETCGIELRTGSDQLDPFYAAFSAFTRSRGTPVVAREIFAQILATFPCQAVLIAAWHEGRVIGGSLKLTVGEVVHNVALFSLDEYRQLHPNYLMYWESIEYAGAIGRWRVDFGRSQAGSGQHRFKLRWAQEETPIYQQFFLHRTSRVPLVAGDSARWGGRLFVRVWQRLPLDLTRAIGPRIRREFPFA